MESHGIHSPCQWAKLNELCFIIWFPPESFHNLSQLFLLNHSTPYRTVNPGCLSLKHPHLLLCAKGAEVQLTFVLQNFIHDGVQHGTRGTSQTWLATGESNKIHSLQISFRFWQNAKKTVSHWRNMFFWKRFYDNLTYIYIYIIYLYIYWL